MSLYQQDKKAAPALPKTSEELKGPRRFTSRRQWERWKKENFSSQAQFRDWQEKDRAGDLPHLQAAIPQNALDIVHEKGRIAAEGVMQRDPETLRYVKDPRLQHFLHSYGRELGHHAINPAFRDKPGAQAVWGATNFALNEKFRPRVDAIAKTNGVDLSDLDQAQVVRQIGDIISTIKSDPRNTGPGGRLSREHRQNVSVLNNFRRRYQQGLRTQARKAQELWDLSEIQADKRPGYIETASKNNISGMAVSFREEMRDTDGDGTSGYQEHIARVRARSGAGLRKSSQSLLITSENRAEQITSPRLRVDVRERRSPDTPVVARTAATSGSNTAATPGSSTAATSGSNTAADKGSNTGFSSGAVTGSATGRAARRANVSRALASEIEHIRTPHISQPPRAASVSQQEVERSSQRVSQEISTEEFNSWKARLDHGYTLPFSTEQSLGFLAKRSQIETSRSEDISRIEHARRGFALLTLEYREGLSQGEGAGRQAAEQALAALKPLEVSLGHSLNRGRPQANEQEEPTLLARRNPSAEFGSRIGVQRPDRSLSSLLDSSGDLQEHTEVLPELRERAQRWFASFSGSSFASNLEAAQTALRQFVEQGKASPEELLQMSKTFQGKKSPEERRFAALLESVSGLS